MEENRLHHRPRHIAYTVIRRLEIEPDIKHAPDGLPSTTANCPDCGQVMMYRGIGRLRTGASVYHFECVHSHREIHSVSITVTE